jgi:hypothetical protein
MGRHDVRGDAGVPAAATAGRCGAAVVPRRHVVSRPLPGRPDSLQDLAGLAIRILETAPATTPGDRQWVDWLVRVEARIPGVDYAEEFRIRVLPADPSVPVAAAPPRAMPELPPERLAERLATAVETVGDATVLRLPFPVPSTAFLILFALVTVAIAAPGMPWTAALDEQDARLGAAAVSGGLAVVMLLVLMLTTRRIEIRRESVRLVRGLFGLGFPFHHSRP